MRSLSLTAVLKDLIPAKIVIYALRHVPLKLLIRRSSIPTHTTGRNASPNGLKSPKRDIIATIAMPFAPQGNSRMKNYFPLKRQKASSRSTRYELNPY